MWVVSYLRNFLSRGGGLPPGSVSRVRCTLHSDQFFIPSHNLLSIVCFYFSWWYIYMGHILKWWEGVKCFLWWYPRLPLPDLHYICKCRCSVRHRWELPVCNYPGNSGNYHYPFFWVIFRVILHDFICKYYHEN